mgnify:CR=1 FL=1
MKEFAPITERMKARNAIATEYVKSQGIEVNDLWSVVADHPEYYAGGDGTHPVDAGFDALARQVAKVVEELCRRRSRAVVKVIFISVRFSFPFWGMGTGFSFCQNVNVRGRDCCIRPLGRSLLEIFDSRARRWKRMVSDMRLWLVTESSGCLILPRVNG